MEPRELFNQKQKSKSSLRFSVQMVTHRGGLSFSGWILNKQPKHIKRMVH